MGAAGELNAGPWRLKAEAAYARANTYMEDTHWLRQNQLGGFAGSTPTDGSNSGVQLEAILSYKFNDHFNVGAGARYWKYYAGNSTTHFDQSAIPVGTYPPQVSELSAERYGLVVEGAYKF